MTFSPVIKRLRELLKERDEGLAKWGRAGVQQMAVDEAAGDALPALLNVVDAAQDAKWDMEDGPAFRRLEDALQALDAGKPGD